MSEEEESSSSSSSSVSVGLVVGVSLGGAIAIGLFCYFFRRYVRSTRQRVRAGVEAKEARVKKLQEQRSRNQPLSALGQPSHSSLGSQNATLDNKLPRGTSRKALRTLGETVDSEHTSPVVAISVVPDADSGPEPLSINVPLTPTQRMLMQQKTGSNSSLPVLEVRDVRNESPPSSPSTAASPRSPRRRHLRGRSDGSRGHSRSKSDGKRHHHHHRHRKRKKKKRAGASQVDVKRGIAAELGVDEAVQDDSPSPQEDAGEHDDDHDMQQHVDAMLEDQEEVLSDAGELATAAAPAPSPPPAAARSPPADAEWFDPELLDKDIQDVFGSDHDKEQT